MINIKSFESFNYVSTNETTGEVFSRPSGRSGLAGQTIGTSWASGGGAEQPGQINIPYNPSGTNRVFQKLPMEMGKNHGAHTGKKSREKKLDMKGLKAMFKKREEDDNRPKKVLSYDDFEKDKMSNITRESFSMNRENCDRCGEPTNGTTIMSIFNEDVICMKCKEIEKKDPDYDAACYAEINAVRSGNHNFKGVYPDYKPLN